MRKRMTILAGALTLSLALAGCNPTQPAVDGREESKTNKTIQTSEELTVEQFNEMHGPGMIIDIENGCVVSVSCGA
ncbi:MAG: hypothetical protein J5825_04215 [Lachnospiraceae bacterium]|nr:hypothetical protein [Lachnospiraceae bacterium]